MEPIALKKHERIIAVTPEYAKGPGWTNRPLWVHIVDYSNNEYRCECIQPEQQTKEIQMLFSIGNAVHQQLVATIKTRPADATSR